MTERRTVSSSGGEKGVKPQVFSQFPVEDLMQVAEVYGFGAEKYEAHNYRRGYEWSKSFDAMMRHAFAFWGGEDLDPESGKPHMAHAAWHAFTLMSFMREHPEFDDRYKAPECDTSEEIFLEEFARRTRHLEGFGPSTGMVFDLKAEIADANALDRFANADSYGVGTNPPKWQDVPLNFGHDPMPPMPMGGGPPPDPTDDGWISGDMRWDPRVWRWVEIVDPDSEQPAADQEWADLQGLS